MRVELLYTEDDPNYMAARQNLVEVLNEDAFETPIQMIAVGSLEDAQLLGFRGSPSIRIDGEDILQASTPEVSLGHRDYGAGGGVPSKSLIRAGVERARGWSHGSTS
jgi:hypothetical protein